MTDHPSKPPASPANSSAATPLDPAAAEAYLKTLMVDLRTNLQRQATVLTNVAQHDADQTERLLETLAAHGAGKPASATADPLPSGPLSESTIAAMVRELTNGIRSALAPMRVAFLGPEHSYSHLATLQFFGAATELVPVRTIASVFEEVISGQANRGVVPMENSTDGRIVDTMEMFTKSSIKVCGEIPLPIHHNLLGSGRREEIIQVSSKPQAISQCRQWLANHLPQAKLVPVSSTTAAAQLAAENPRVAAIASAQAGMEYGLNVLAKNIEDNQHNVTRFAVIGAEVAARTGRDKTSLMFELAHQPGALADAMMIFKTNSLNLTWIESLPKPALPNEYIFFVELFGHETDAAVQQAIESLRQHCPRVQTLGSYPQG